MWLRRSGSGEPEARAADEGGYIASASDLMIGLLFVFIILVGRNVSDFLPIRDHAHFVAGVSALGARR